MNKLLRKINFIKNLMGLGYILFYCGYVLINLSVNKGNPYINLALLITAVIYVLLYVFTSFIVEDKKLKKASKKNYKRAKKTIAFINALMVVTSVVVNDFNAFISIVMACITIGTYCSYLFFEFIVYVISSKIKKIQNKIRSKHDNRG